MMEAIEHTAPRRFKALREDLATQSEEKIKEKKIFVGCIHFG